MPKQFVKLFSDKSLFQLTVARNLNVCNEIIVVSNTDQYFVALDQLKAVYGSGQFILESIARNTAPAIALSCLMLDPEDIVLVTPSDHLIKDELEYKNVISQAKQLATQNYLVTFGITPTFPEVGFGYIEKINDYDVKAFHEKPNLQTAKNYLNSGNYYWNSGMFCFKAGVFLEELNKYSPLMYEACVLAFKHKDKISQTTSHITPDFMYAIPENSIDYAVMEKSSIVKVIPCNIGWSDVGSFDALYEELAKDDSNNTQNTNHISINSSNNLVLGDERCIATVDVEDLLIVDTADALLISKKGSSQKVKNIVTHLKSTNTELHNIHLTAHRPWGTYTVLEDTVGYKIKKIIVNPSKRLSLQKHFHRNEHWIVVSGTAKVIVNDKEFILKQNESTYIQAGDIHRLENPGKIDLVLIEVQVGSYLGEDDIVRVEDDFRRS